MQGGVRLRTTVYTKAETTFGFDHATRLRSPMHIR
jgi:hypothetical protein